jgi:hypothetical protein
MISQYRDYLYSSSIDTIHDIIRPDLIETLGTSAQCGNRHRALGG